MKKISDTPKPRRYYYYLLAVLVVTLIPSFYYLYKQLEENSIVNNYLTSNNLDDLPISKESAFRIAAQVAKDFNVDQKTFKVLKMDQRSFLRTDAGTLLTCKEGLCGEGTRVIVRLLNTSGYDATRITLYDRFMQYAHTLVSVRMDTLQFWIDSINSGDSLKTFLEHENISSDDFSYLNYSDNISDRLKKIEYFQSVAKSSEDFNRNMGKYFIFSYEAIPLTKLLSEIGLNFRVFNLQRPPRFISVLAEKPYTVLFIFYFLLSILITFIFSRALVRFVK